MTRCHIVYNCNHVQFCNTFIVHEHSEIVNTRQPLFSLGLLEISASTVASTSREVFAKDVQLIYFRCYGCFIDFLSEKWERRRKKVFRQHKHV
jgi:hypothetical protein